MTPLRQRFIEDMCLQGLSPKTQKSYLLNVVVLSRHFNKSPKDLCTEDLRSYFVYLTKEKHFAPNTLGQHLYAIKFIWEKTLSREWELSSSIKKKRSLKLPVILSVEEVNKLINSIYDANHRMAFKLIYNCGLRSSEALYLKPEHVDLDRQVLHIHNGKGNKDRIVPFPRILKEQLQEMLKHHSRTDYVFPSRSNHTRPCCQTLWQMLIKKCCKQCGIIKKVSLHSLRHSYATHLFERGVDISIIQKLLGHKHISSTQIYTHLTKKTDDIVRAVVDHLLIPAEENV